MSLGVDGITIGTKMTGMKIYTKTGDSGMTGLFAGQRVHKDNVRIQAYGTVDELNAYIGVVIASLEGDGSTQPALAQQSMQEILKSIQGDLFCIGAELATPDPDRHNMRMLNSNRVDDLESVIDAAEAELPKLTSFILPGGSLPAAQLHFARTVCRRAERELVSLTKVEGVSDYSNSLIYLNRLADLLFVLARWVNRRLEHTELHWHNPKV